MRKINYTYGMKCLSCGKHNEFENGKFGSNDDLV